MVNSRKHRSYGLAILLGLSGTGYWVATLNPNDPKVRNVAVNGSGNAIGADHHKKDSIVTKDIHKKDAENKIYRARRWAIIGSSGIFAGLFVLLTIGAIVILTGPFLWWN